MGIAVPHQQVGLALLQHLPIHKPEYLASTWLEETSYVMQGWDRESSKALNRTAAPSYSDHARVDDFLVECDRAQRTFTVRGKALERFTQMTDWSYFESVLRVQKVLEAAGQRLTHRRLASLQKGAIPIPRLHALFVAVITLHL